MEKGKESRIEVVQSPANTSHFLQPCDSTINKTFKKTTRKKRDLLNSISLLKFGSMQIKLMIGVAGFRALTPNIVKDAFVKTGLWLMDFHFVEFLPSPDRIKRSTSRQLSERKTLRVLRDIISINEEDPTRVLQCSRNIVSGPSGTTKAVRDAI